MPTYSIKKATLPSPAPLFSRIFAVGDDIEDAVKKAQTQTYRSMYAFTNDFVALLFSKRRVMAQLKALLKVFGLRSADIIQIEFVNSIHQLGSH